MLHMFADFLLSSGLVDVVSNAIDIISWED